MNAAAGAATSFAAKGRRPTEGYEIYVSADGKNFGATLLSKSLEYGQARR